MEDKMNGPDAVREIAKQVGGEIKEMGRLPDGSGFAIMSMPLPKDHWIGVEGYNIPPMPFRMGSTGLCLSYDCATHKPNDEQAGNG